MCSRSADRKIVLGALGKPFGIKGFLYINYYSGDFSSINSFDYFLVGKDLEKLKIQEIRIHQEKCIILFQGINNRNKAELLRNKEVNVFESDLPVLKSGKYYWYELEGLTVFNECNKNFGKIRKIIETGANDVMVVSASDISIDNKERLIPYVDKKVIKKVEIKEKKIYVEWPEDY